MKTVRKVRALPVDRKGRAYGITADATHVLQLPGGGLKSGESWKDGLHREMHEELGRTVEIVGKPVKITVARNGVREITRCYPVLITGGDGRPTLTKREAARGLRVSRFPSRKALAKALKRRVARRGRSAARRDLALTLALA
jgi:ADP-ribose pyrophosphatase YjhB (NUDIX family)